MRLQVHVLVFCAAAGLGWLVTHLIAQGHFAAAMLLVAPINFVCGLSLGRFLWALRPKRTEAPRPQPAPPFCLRLVPDEELFVEATARRYLVALALEEAEEIARIRGVAAHLPALAARLREIPPLTVGASGPRAEA